MLALGALGVVYGDIGTSPLYAIKECFNPEYGLAPMPDSVIGICSLMFWAILAVVVVEYIGVVMRADNKGEAGILALLAAITPRSVEGNPTRSFKAIVYLALIGTALLGADGTITPAISVLSAVEGLEIATPALKPIVASLTIVIIAGIFLIQRRGTARISAIFGPTMLVWFMS